MDPKARENIGDALVVDDAEAVALQTTLEKALRKKLKFKINRGDLVLTQYNQMPKESSFAKRNQSVGHSYVSFLLLFKLFFNITSSM
jgi:hypothetical protein